MISRAAPLIGLLIFFIACIAHAEHRKTDIITLYNGDRVTGEIESLFGGILLLDTDSMGKIRIEWQEIARIESEFFYEVRLSNSDRYYGSVVETDRAGQLGIQDLDGEHAFEWLEVVELRPIEDKFAEQIDVYLSAGYNYTKASSVAQTTFNTTVSYEDELSRSSFNGRVTLTDTSDDDTSSTKLDISRMTWTNREKLFRVFFGNYESNDELGLENRISAGLGWGRYTVDNSRMRWSIAGGAQVLTEETSDGEELESAELFINTEFATWDFNTPELDVQITANLFPSLTESGRVRGDTDIRIRWELVEDLFWDITAYGVYDSDAESENEFDYGITTGLGWNY